jgi:hypothetical protein
MEESREWRADSAGGPDYWGRPGGRRRRICLALLPAPASAESGTRRTAFGHRLPGLRIQPAVGGTVVLTLLVDHPSPADVAVEAPAFRPGSPSRA